MPPRSDPRTVPATVIQWLNKMDVRSLLALMCLLLILNLVGSIDIRRTVSVLNRLPGLIDWQESAEARLRSIETDVKLMMETLKEKHIMIYGEATTATIAYEAEYAGGGSGASHSPAHGTQAGYRAPIHSHPGSG